MIAIDAVHHAAISRADHRAALRVKRHGVNQILRVAPDLARVTVGLDTIYFRAAGYGGGIRRGGKRRRQRPPPPRSSRPPRVSARERRPLAGRHRSAPPAAPPPPPA